MVFAVRVFAVAAVVLVLVIVIVGVLFAAGERVGGGVAG